MDMHRTAKEIGLFLTAINLVAVMDSPDVQDKVGASMPLPGSNIEEKVHDIVKWLTGFGKRKYMFLTPEIAVIEELLKQTDNKAEVIRCRLLLMIFLIWRLKNGYRIIFLTEQK